jgi:hypothetical protein
MPSDVVEERLATIEGLMPNALASIRRFQIPRRGTPERLLLASLLALQYIRTPDRMEMATFPVDALKSANGVRPVSKAAIIMHFFNPYDDKDPRDYPSELPTDAVVEERCRLPRELRRVSAGSGPRRPRMVDRSGEIFRAPHEAIDPSSTRRGQKMDHPSHRHLEGVLVSMQTIWARSCARLSRRHTCGH